MVASTTTDVAICNMALAAMGTRSTITSLTDGSNEALYANLLFAPTRDALLRLVDWNFARNTATLTNIKTASSGGGSTPWSSAQPPPPWQYEYVYPADCLKARKVLPQSGSALNGQSAGFLIGTDGGQTVVLTNTPAAILVYTQQVTSEALWDPLFVDALVLWLGAKLAIPLAGDRALAQELLKQADPFIKQAAEQALSEGFAIDSTAPDVTLCNQALLAVGAHPITTFSDGTKEADVASIYYAQTQQSLLRMADWNFAEKTAILTLYKAAPGTPENPTLPATDQWSTSYPPPPWQYEYSLPTDCARVRRVMGQQGSLGFSPPLFPVLTTPIQYQRQQKFRVAYDTDVNGNPIEVVLTNQENALIVYTASFNFPADAPPDFNDALVAMLAAKFALPITGDKALAKMRFDLANAAIARARVSDGNEGVTVNNPVPSWLADRGAWQSYPSLDDSWFEAPFGPEFPVL